jgi:hypothetical protein
MKTAIVTAAARPYVGETGPERHRGSLQEEILMTRTFFRTLAVTLGALGALIVLPSAVMADTVDIVMTSAGVDTSHGVYISPYYATVNGGPTTTVICDDFTDDTYIPESWTATVYAGSGVLTGTRMAGLSGFTGADLYRAYDAVAYLALRLQSEGADPTARAITSFALWDIFLDSSVTTWLSGDAAFLGQVQTLANEARTSALGASAGLRSILTVYSTPISNISGGHALPQEFISTPEASAPAFLAFDLLGLLGVAFCVRRRSLRNAGILR